MPWSAAARCRGSSAACTTASAFRGPQCGSTCWWRSCSCSSSAAGGSSRKSSRSPPSSPISWCPVSVAVLQADRARFASPAAHARAFVPAPLAFVLATLMLYWARWPHTGEIMLLLILPMPIYLYYQARGKWHDFGRHLKGAWWLIAYLAAIVALLLGGQQGVRGARVHRLRLGPVMRGARGAVFFLLGHAQRLEDSGARGAG